MKKINTKTVVLIVVSLAVIGLLVFGINQIRVMMTGASSGIEPQGVTAVSGDDGKTATITWTSNKESMAKVEYGTTAASLVLMSAESSMTTDHRVLLSSLQPGKTYHYRIRVGEEIFDNGGIPYNFKTKSEKTEATPTAIPTVAVNQATSSGLVCDPKVDYNKDGVVNSFDLMACKKDGGRIVTSPASSPAAKTTPAAVDCNNNTIDYNSDGVVNAIDRINCLQSKSR
ncbi:MAG TPA: fibronectin type III domain-containing protein [Candidatus Woesebacteria bacterium]|jgi:hypothetical protein|nr:fibronectin type III domain-containing protein [Candidatus Shapirobacteria bacterium]HOR02034.1 fibronectin type III domain-containing protein [Candidatus Woesebacteria bacterium]